MQLGVRDGKVVSVRGNPDHPVNLGKLCPKGLAEHYAIEAEDRAKYPLLRKNGNLTRVSWDEALDTLVKQVPRCAEQVRAGVAGDCEHGAVGDRGVLCAGKAGAAWVWNAELRWQHNALHVHRCCRIQAILRQRWAARCLRGPGDSRCDSPDRRECCGESSHPLHAAGGQHQADPDCCRSARDQDGDDGRYLSCL